MKSFERAKTLVDVVVMVLACSGFDAGSTLAGGSSNSAGLSISEIACRRLVPLSSIEWRNRRSSLHSFSSTDYHNAITLDDSLDTP